ncbi:Double zinc ribbon [Planctomycetes bacterium Pan216]|uniref:Double zinc ribbon n=1 Tax=Kolteria novifilia TaxID=2527975 RepID=A0A518BD08_9BACT|nr:Double zinc ribbon [Planctomycetes bacterium Pan216]
MDRKIDPRHDQIRPVLRLVGPAMMGVGGILIAIGMISFFSAFGGFGPPRFFWCAFLGIPLFGIGSGVTKFAYMGAITRYLSQEISPVGRDTFNYMADGTQDGIRTITSAISQGLASGVDDRRLKAHCPQCSSLQDADANFCSACGAAMPKEKFCASCGAENDPDAKFCDACGQRFESRSFR